jgi:transcriptional regulator with XRE-family HTH domain
MMNGFGELLKEARQKAKLTQIELAEKVGIDHSYISKIEKGSYLPNRNTVLTIIDSLGITDSAERARFLLTAGYAGLEDIAKLDGEQQRQRSAFSSPFSLVDQFAKPREASFAEEVEKILNEARLPYTEGELTRVLILEQARTICRVMKERLEKK